MIDKIDLDALNQRTRPEKKSKEERKALRQQKAEEQVPDKPDDAA